MIPMTRLVAALLMLLALAGCSSTPPKAAAARAAAHTCADLDLPGQTWGHILVDATRAAQLDDRWEGLYQALSDLRDIQTHPRSPEVVRDISARVTRECRRATTAAG